MRERERAERGSSRRDAPRESDDFADVFNAYPDDAELTLADLAGQSRHVAWRSEVPPGRKKPTKVPYDPIRGRKAKADDPETWGTRKQAERRAKRLLEDGAEGGIGIELGELPDGRHLCGMDLDTCRDPETGRLKDWARAIVDRLKTYTEVSPSLTGLKAFFLMSAADVASFRAATGNEHTKKFDRGSGEHPPGSETVVSNKYFTITGDRLPGCPDTLREVPFTDLGWWIETEGPMVASGGSGRDDSRSARAMRLVGKFKCRGQRKSDWVEALNTDLQLAQWAELERNVNRAWERFDCSDYDVERLNELHALVMVRGKALIATEREDGGTDFGPERDLHALYANDRVTVTDKKTEAISQRWMRDPIRRTYRAGIEFAPGRETPGKFNLWRGWAVEPDIIASCELFLKHIREVVCGGNQAHFEYLIGWLAHMVQRPHEKPGVGVVLRGLKGTGKDSVGEYIAAMIGRHHAPTVSQSEHIVGRFNFRLESALMLHVQEGSWAGDRKAEEVLKYLVTSPFVEIERKGIDSINLPSVLRIFISANASWVVPASPDERRWAVFEVSDAKRNDRQYWVAFHAERQDDGPAALLHYLQRYDLSDFDVSRVPDTDGLRNQKLASLRGVNRWWFDVLYSGEIGSNFQAWEDETLAIEREELRSLYASYARGRPFDGPPLDARDFGKAMREMMKTLGDARPHCEGSRVRQYILPPLPVARREFETWLRSPIDWESD